MTILMCSIIVMLFGPPLIIQVFSYFDKFDKVAVFTAVFVPIVLGGIGFFVY